MGKWYSGSGWRGGEKINGMERLGNDFDDFSFFRSKESTLFGPLFSSYGGNAGGGRGGGDGAGGLLAADRPRHRSKRPQRNHLLPLHCLQPQPSPALPFGEPLTSAHYSCKRRSLRRLPATRATCRRAGQLKCTPRRSSQGCFGQPRAAIQTVRACARARWCVWRAGAIPRLPLLG